MYIKKFFLSNKKHKNVFFKFIKKRNHSKVGSEACRVVDYCQNKTDKNNNKFVKKTINASYLYFPKLLLHPDHDSEMSF